MLELRHNQRALLDGIIPLVIKFWVTEVIARFLENDGQDGVHGERAECIGQVDHIACALIAAKSVAYSLCAGDNARL